MNDVTEDPDLDEDAVRAEVRERRKLAAKSSENAAGESGKSGGEKDKDKSTTSTKKKSSKKDDSSKSSEGGKKVKQKSSEHSDGELSEPAPVAEAVDLAPDDQHEFWFEALAYDDQAALDAGYMIDCDGAWYCVHWWTDYGQQILSLEVGDVVHVNGSTAVIDYFYELARDSYIDDVRADVGYDGILLQTCYYGGSPTMRLCHGYYI